jgi:hypothetical protein
VQTFGVCHNASSSYFDDGGNVLDNFEATIKAAYADTMASFTKLSAVDAYRKYVCPPALNGAPGFAIFYTPVIYRPRLLIVGQNPSDFSDVGSLTADPNGEWLSGSVPTRNSYLDDQHDFALALRRLFAKHGPMLRAAVGMNVWHYQSKSKAHLAPECLINHCVATTQTLVKAMDPQAILCFGRPAFDALRGQDDGMLIAETKARRVITSSTGIWYVQHPSARWSRTAAAHDMPIVLGEISAFLDRRVSGSPSSYEATSHPIAMAATSS